jgi:hypothetical protein
VAQPADDTAAIARLLSPASAETPDPFAAFWSSAPSFEPAVVPETEPGTYRALMSRVVLPIGVVTALLAALMAWIG